MSVRKLQCQACGAPIEIPDQVRFFTCGHCETALEVHAGEGAAWTQLAEQIRADVSVLRARAELAQLEQDWSALQQQEEDARNRVHGGKGCGLAIVLFAIALLGQLAIAETENPLVPVVFASIAGVGLLVFLAAAIPGPRRRSHAAAEQRYRERRAELLAEIEPPRD